MGGDSRGFMGMGSLLGDAIATQQSQHDRMNQMGAAQANMYAQQQAMMQAQMYHIPREYTADGMRERSKGAASKLSQMIRKLPSQTAAYRGINDMLPFSPCKSNIDKLRDEVRAWTKRAA